MPVIINCDMFHICRVLFIYCTKNGWVIIGSIEIKTIFRYKVFYLQMIATMKYRRCNIITEYVKKWEKDNI